MYTAPEKATPSAQITTLEAEIQKTKGKGLAVPPGLYAHLGLLYYKKIILSKSNRVFPA